MIDVDSIATDADLDEFLGGQALAGANMVPRAWRDGADEPTLRPARQWALEQILAAMRRRSPPIDPAQLADVSQLKQAILLGASERLYRLAMTGAGQAEVAYYQANAYAAQFASEINNLAPTLTGGVRATMRSRAVYRR